MSLIFKEFNIKKIKISGPTILWFLLSLIAVFIQISKGKESINNYLIFKGVFWHTIQQINLFSLYPTEYFDSNHYGSFFSIIIAPFALLPDSLGCMLWGICNAFVLFYAVKKLPISLRNQEIILLIAAIELMTSMHNLQFNPMLTSFVIFSFVFVHEKKDFWATLFIAAGFLTKIYGIVGLAFILFSENKLTFILSFIFWLIVLSFLPMIFSSPSFIYQSYSDWYHSIIEKNEINQDSVMQGMNIMRLIKRTINIDQIQNIYFYVFGAVAALTAFLANLKQLRNLQFQLCYLGFLLISIVIFSTSSESSTFIIAMMGVAIWYVIQEPKNTWIYFTIIFALVLTSLSTTDLFPQFIKINYIRPYAIKALPCFIIWITLVYQMIFNIKKSPLTQ